MISNKKPIIEPPMVFDAVRAFYSNLVANEGPTPAGVDWPDARRQTIRFRELCRLFPMTGEKFSVLDYGCGYGAFLTYLEEHNRVCDYFGFDISENMIETAKRIHPTMGLRFRDHLDADELFDFVVMSGVFHVKRDVDVQAWEDEVWKTVDLMHKVSRKGFGFNVLSAWREPHRKKEFLYYGDPAQFLERVWKYSPNIALLHDYDLWDFTVLVRKEIEAQP